MNSINAQCNPPKKSLPVQHILKYASVILLVLMIVFNGIFTKNFFGINTFWNLLIHSSAIILVGLSMTFVISSGGIDISVGSTMAIAGMLTVKLLPLAGAVPAVICAVIAGCLFGLFNGAVISLFRIQPIIVTLATMMAGRGIAQIIGDGYILPFQDDFLSSLGILRIGGVVPIQVIYIIVAVLIFYLISKYTVFSRRIEAIGDNKTAAWLAGVNIESNTIFVYGLNGLMCALAGIMIIARANAADPDTIGKSFELNAIAAVAIGGTPMSGGKARIFGTVLGAVILQLITITINMNGISYDWSLIFQTVVIILFVFIQNVTQKAV